MTVILAVIGCWFKIAQSHQKIKMETTELLCALPICRLCGEESVNGNDLSSTENGQELCELINKYLPLKVENDGKFPSKICPGCNIQLEATKSFMELIVEGQSKLRQLYKMQQDKLHRQEKQRQQLEEVLKSVNPNSSVDTYTIEADESGEKFVIQIFSQGPLFPPEHELSLRTEGLTKPKRKRGRPPKTSQPKPEDNSGAGSTPVAEIENVEEETEDGKRKRKIKVPTRYLEAIQGKELEKVFKQEGVIDEEEFILEEKSFAVSDPSKTDEVIGRIEDENGEDLGEPVVIRRTANRPKPKVKFSGPSRKRRRYQCEICGREFLHHGRYELHKKLHEVEYSCCEEGCDFKCGKRSELALHQKDTGHSGLTATEKLDEYGTIELPSDLKNESTTDDKSDKGKVPTKKSFMCEKCNKSFSCKQNYEVHLKAVHGGERPFLCKVCDKTFSYSHSLKIHQLQHFCKTEIEEQTTPQYRCLTCMKVFRHPSSLQYHRDSEHTNGRRFVCNICNKPFKHRQLLQRHQLVHSDERPHRCSQCLSAFKTRANLIHHARTVHAGERTHWCVQCGKTFAHKTALNLHQRWHLGVRPYECDFCQKAFSQKGNLAEHRRIHTGEKPYQCDICRRAFTTSSQYKLHKKRHLDERPHKCEYCPKSFLHKVTLRCHMRRHFDERPYKCQYCTKSFAEAWALKKHERLHTGEKPYKCDICEKAFADNSNLAKHRKTHRSLKSLTEKQMLYVTYEKEGGDAIVTYIEPQDPMLENEVIDVTEEAVQLQQFVDEEGNPISFTTQDGQQVKMVVSNENGQENIQGLLPDGSLVPINITSMADKSKPIITIQNNFPPQKMNELDFDKQILTNTIEFLSEDDPKSNNIQFVTDENQGMCLVTTYNVDDSINNQYLNIS